MSILQIGDPWDNTVTGTQVVNVNTAGSLNVSNQIMVGRNKAVSYLNVDAGTVTTAILRSRLTLHRPVRSVSLAEVFSLTEISTSRLTPPVRRPTISMGVRSGQMPSRRVRVLVRSISMEALSKPLRAMGRFCRGSRERMFVMMER